MRRSRILPILSVLGAFSVSLVPSAVSAGGGDSPAQGRSASADEPPTDQVIVSYENDDDGLSDADVEKAAGRGARKLRKLDARSEVIKLSGPQGGAQLGATMRSLANRPGVALVEPDTIMQALDVPNDPSFPVQWDLSNPATSGVQGINAAAAWDVNAGSLALTIAVIDTGYLNHADLAGRVVGGYDFISDARIGNDGNARDASALDAGDWISTSDTATAFFAGCSVGNSSWHGTHVAGTIGAATNNNVGIAGINRNSNIISARVLGKCGGYTSDIVDGMKWSAGLAVIGVPANPNPARVLNLSLGGSGACSSTYQNAIDAITAAGAVVVVAAGNSNADAGAFSPASCAGVITVAATGKTGNRSYYSNYGASIEVAAPGGDKNADGGDTILSTLNSGTTTPAADSYAKYQGTSMATPHVVGVVSLMLSANPSLTPSQVTQVLQSTSRPFPVGSTCAGICGSGIIDAAAAVAGSSPPQSAPGAFAKTSPANGATRLRTPVTLAWNASSGATSYEYCIDTSVNNNCDSTWVRVSTTSASVSVNARTTYSWQVRAVNTVGTTVADGGSWRSFTTR